MKVIVGMKFTHKQSKTTIYKIESIDRSYAVISWGTGETTSYHISHILNKDLCRIINLKINPNFIEYVKKELDLKTQV